MVVETQNACRTTHLLALMKKGDDAFNARDSTAMKAVHHPQMVAHIAGSSDGAVPCFRITPRKDT